MSASASPPVASASLTFDAPDTCAPLPPIESHIVRAGVAVERLRSHVSVLGFQIEHGSRDAEGMTKSFSQAQAELTAAWEAWCAYRAVLTCKGSA